MDESRPYMVVTVRVSAFQKMTTLGSEEALMAYLQEHGIDTALPFTSEDGFATAHTYYRQQRFRDESMEIGGV